MIDYTPESNWRQNWLRDQWLVYVFYRAKMHSELLFTGHEKRPKGALTQIRMHLCLLYTVYLTQAASTKPHSFCLILHGTDDQPSKDPLNIMCLLTMDRLLNTF